VPVIPQFAELLRAAAFQEPSLSPRP